MRSCLVTLSQRFASRAALILVLLFGASLLWGQFGGQGTQPIEGPSDNSGGPRRPQGPGRGFGRRPERIPDRSEYPTWQIAPEFKHDVFTFARIQFDSYLGRGFGQNWNNDYPDCDWNFSYRLSQMTSLKVDPNGKVLRLTDPELFDMPFIYMSNAQQMVLSEEEISALRRYLSGGGFLMIDDFWAPAAWDHIRDVMQQVLPDRQTQELGLEHEIFHFIYDLKALPQVPSILAWRRGETFEYWHGDPEGDEGPHFYGITDAEGRLAVLLCHNNDIGDGWERKGEDIEYFKEYSERWSYPLGINVVMYAMTH